MSNSKESCRLLNVALSAHRGKHSSYIGEFLLNTTTVWERCFYFIFIFSKEQQSWIADSELGKTSPYFLDSKLKSSPQEKTPSLLLSEGLQGSCSQVRCFHRGLEISCSRGSRASRVARVLCSRLSHLKEHFIITAVDGKQLLQNNQSMKRRAFWKCIKFALVHLWDRKILQRTLSGQA